VTASSHINLLPSELTVQYISYNVPSIVIVLSFIVSKANSRKPNPLLLSCYLSLSCAGKDLIQIVINPLCCAKA